MITEQQATQIKDLASKIAIAEGKYSQATTRTEQDCACKELHSAFKEFYSYVDSLKGHKMKSRLPIGLTFQRKRFPKAKELTEYTIKDIYSTFNNAGKCVKLEYQVTHNFLGQPIAEFMCDTTIARSLTNEQLSEYCK